MINRIQHYINGVEFVPVNKDSFTLTASFPDNFGEWENQFTADNKVVLSQEAYLELIRHLDTIGVQQMPTYTIKIDGQSKDFFVDLYQNVKVAGSFAEVTIKNFNSKDNIKTNIDSLTFEYLFMSGLINQGDMVYIPFVVVPSDVGGKLIGIISLMYVITDQIIKKIERIATRIGDLLAGTIPSTGFGVVYPIGNIVRYGILIAIDIAILILLTFALKALMEQCFDMLLPPVRNLKAMTVDRLLTIGLAQQGLSYNSSLKDTFKKLTVLPVPVDFQNKNFFQLLMNEDTRVLNRGYPTSSDTVPTLGTLITELSKMYNLKPRLENYTLNLEPKSLSTLPITTNLDSNFNNQETKENEFTIDLSKVWNTKILSYKNDVLDKMLFDNPKGLRVEHKTVPVGVSMDELTMIKGFDEIRVNFALGTLKSDTALEDFLGKLASHTDNFLGTSFNSKIKKRKGVLAISQDEFSVTKILYQIGGKQTNDYLNKISAAVLYNKYHQIDDSKNNLYNHFSEMPVRMNNYQFSEILTNNIVNLEGQEVEIINVNYSVENSKATIDYKTKQLDWAKNLKGIKVYEE